MYKIPVQSETPHQHMLILYQHMMQWTANSKRALDRGDLEEHHRLLERMTDMQQRIISLFEPPHYATETQRKACQLVQAVSRKTLAALLDYINDPRAHYTKLCQVLMQAYTGWQQLEKKTLS